MHCKSVDEKFWHCCTICNAGKKCFFFFYFSLNSFLTMKSILTENSVEHTLKDNSPHYLMHPMWCTHFRWQGSTPFLATPLSFGQMGSSTFWSFHLLTVCVPPSCRKLEISVNIYTRALKFWMMYPWTQAIRFRENQILLLSVSLLVGLLPYWN